MVLWYFFSDTWPLTFNLLVTFVVFLPFVPLIFRYSRVIWMHVDWKLDPGNDYNCARVLCSLGEGYDMTDSVETVWKFPCAFPLKAFGRNDDDFEALVLEIVRRNMCLTWYYCAITSRISSGNTYRAVTATFMARSREQLDALYLEMT